MCFLAGSRGEFLWVERANICGIGFGPARSRAFLSRDGKLRVRFTIGRKKASRISHYGLALAIRIDSGGNLAFLNGQIAGMPDGPGSFFSGEGGGLFDETVHGAITLFSWHRQKARILRLAVCKRERNFDRGAKRVFMNAIGCGARSAAVDDRANRHRQPVLGNVLMDGVVGETRQRVRNFVHMDFRLFGSRGFRETKNGIDDSPKLALVEKFSGSGARCR